MTVIILILTLLGLAEPAPAPTSGPDDHIPRGGLMHCVPCAAWCLFEVPNAPA